MTLLRKDDILLERDEKGELLPIKGTLETSAKEEIVVKPMARGEIQALFNDAKNLETTRDQDKEIILNNCLEPKFTSDEVDSMKFYMSNAIVTTIMRLSGLHETKNKDKIAAETKNS